MNDKILEAMAAAMREAHPRNNNRGNAIVDAMRGFDYDDVWIMAGMWEVLESHSDDNDG